MRDDNADQQIAAKTKERI